MPLYLRCETPLHAGTGAVLGLVDLPIQRERHTGYPKVEASGLKGSLREAFDGLRDKGDMSGDDIDRLFGPEKGDLHAGALGFTDARLLLFPVRSARGVFAMATCRAILDRLSEDLKLCKDKGISASPGTVCNGSDLLVGNKAILEEYAMDARADGKTDDLADWLGQKLFPGDQYWAERLKKTLIVMEDGDFANFVDLYTEVITRNRINPDTGTVEEHMLFTEEYLPAESALYSLALFSPVFAKDKGSLNSAADVQGLFAGKLPEYFQLGGNATLGKGIIRIVK